MKKQLIPVKELAPGLRNACLERGRSLNEEITPLMAVKEWAGWHLGDSTWASDIIAYYEDPRGKK